MVLYKVIGQSAITWRLFLIIILSVVMIVCFSSLAVKKSGFCFIENRYFSADEKIDKAINYIIASYPPVIQVIEKKSGSKDIINRKRPDNPIKYGSIKEFKLINPDCCSLSQTGKKGYEIPMVDKLLGRLDTFVHINYSIRYFDRNQNNMSLKAESYVALTNCGMPWSGI